MAAGDKLLLDSASADKLLLGTGSADTLLIQGTAVAADRLLLDSASGDLLLLDSVSADKLLLGSTTAATETVDEWWAGARKPTTFDVWAALSASTSTARLEVATDSGFSSIVFTSTATATTNLAGAGDVVKIQATGLTADTAYYFRFTVDGNPITTRTGQIRTAQTSGTAKSFSVAIGSCSQHTLYTPNSTIWDHIRTSGAHEFIHLGDLHYGDNTAADAQSVYRADILSHLQIAKVAALYDVMPVAYTWDDHDHGGANNAHMATTGFATFAQLAATAYTDMVPHYPLEQPVPTTEHVRGITQSWDNGRVRFIMPDLRSFASLGNTLLGDGNTYNSMVTWDGEAWMEAELADAVTSGIELIVILSSRTWKSGTATSHGWEEQWPTYQQTFAELLIDNGIKAVVIAGDSHKTGFDDGTDVDFTNGKGRLPHIMSSPLNHLSLQGSGPYIWRGTTTERPTSGSTEHHQFVLFTVTDNGTKITWTAEAFDETGASVLGPVSSTDLEAPVPMFRHYYQNLMAGAA